MGRGLFGEDDLVAVKTMMILIERLEWSFFSRLKPKLNV